MKNKIILGLVLITLVSLIYFNGTSTVQTEAVLNLSVDTKPTTLAPNKIIKDDQVQVNPNEDHDHNHDHDDEHIDEHETHSDTVVNETLPNDDQFDEELSRTEQYPSDPEQLKEDIKDVYRDNDLELLQYNR